MKNIVVYLLAATNPAEKLIDLCSFSSGAVLVPGVHDALSARIFQQKGAQALFLSGFGVSSTLLGQPDAGILTYSEMESMARIVCSTANEQGVPVLVDGDTGYGGSANMRRAIQGFASVGAAAVTIEDQVFPKKCTYIAGASVRVVERPKSIARIKAALAARQEALEKDGNRILVVGRTDCRAALGLEEALIRCQLFQELGCDIVYAENLHSSKEYMELRKHIKCTTPMMMAQVQTQSDSPQKLYTLQEASDMDYQLMLMGISGLQAVVETLQSLAKDMQEGGGLASPQTLASFEAVKDVVDYSSLQDFEFKFNCE
jgi:2-methylisocitrate lyase-like PEP mutase family enzyme